MIELTESEIELVRQGRTIGAVRALSARTGRPLKECLAAVRAHPEHDSPEARKNQLEGWKRVLSFVFSPEWADLEGGDQPPDYEETVQEEADRLTDCEP